MNHIVDDIFLGDWEDARNAVSDHRPTLCVIELNWGEEENLSPTYYEPILALSSETGFPIFPVQARIDQLDKCVRIISNHVERGDELLVHCYAGMERSPLTLAYWLVKTGREDSIPDAYCFLKSKRPIIEDRSSWLPE